MKTKICHIVNVITGKTDGVFYHIKSLINYLDKSKYEHILVYQGGGSVKEEESIREITIYEIPEMLKPFSIKAIKDIIKIVRQNNIDIIHAHVVKPYLFSGLANFILNKKLIFNYHGLFILNNSFYNLLQKILMYFVHIFIVLFKKVDIVLVPSKYSKKLLLKETKLFPQIKQYYNGIDISLLNNNNVTTSEIELGPNNLIKIMIVARLAKEKRLDKAFLIIKKLIDNDVKLKVATYGDGILEEQLKILAKNLNLESIIEFKGYQKDIIYEYKKFDLLLLTSDSEGLPLSILEAMANGIPVVSTDVGGVSEVLIENNCGFVFKKENIADGVNLILKLINDEKLRLQMGKNGVDAIIKKFSIIQFKNSFEQLYTGLLNER